MIRIEDFEMEAERNRQNLLQQKVEAKRQREATIQNTMKEMEKEKRLAERRASVESKRWDTPLLAFATWESRTRTLVDLINKFAEEFKEESDRKRREYRSQI